LWLRSQAEALILFMGNSVGNSRALGGAAEGACAAPRTAVWRGSTGGVADGWQAETAGGRVSGHAHGVAGVAPSALAAVRCAVDRPYPQVTNYAGRDFLSRTDYFCNPKTQSLLQNVGTAL
jgi:hypothetical protein